MRKMKRILVSMLVMAMVMTMPGVAMVHAETKTTPVTSTPGAHTLYVRKENSTELLGKMRISRTMITNTEVCFGNIFTANTKCEKVTVYASYKDGDYATNTKSSMKQGDVVSITKSNTYGTETSASKSKVYGKCKVTYN